MKLTLGALMARVKPTMPKVAAVPKPHAPKAASAPRAPRAGGSTLRLLRLPLSKVRTGPGY